MQFSCCNRWQAREAEKKAYATLHQFRAVHEWIANRQIGKKRSATPRQAHNIVCLLPVFCICCWWCLRRAEGWFCGWDLWTHKFEVVAGISWWRQKGSRDCLCPAAGQTGIPHKIFKPLKYLWQRESGNNFFLNFYDVYVGFCLLIRVGQKSVVHFG